MYYNYIKNTLNNVKKNPTLKALFYNYRTFNVSEKSRMSSLGYTKITNKVPFTEDKMNDMVSESYSSQA